MNSSSKLKSKHCVPCEGEVAPLKREHFEGFLPEIPEWEVVEDKELTRDFKFKDFKEALSFVNKVGEIAEQEGHHPDISLHDWNHVRITLSTHAIGGLSENDFILASKTDELI